MIALVKLHSYYLLTKKTQLITGIFTFLTLFLILIIARPFDAKIDRILYHSTYVLDYTIEGMTLIKMAMFITGLYSVLHLSLLTPYDTVLIQRTHTFIYVLSKYITIWFYTILMTGILSVYYGLFSYLIYNTVHPMLTPKAALVGLTLTTLYTGFLYAISLISKHYLALILVMFSFFISDMFVSINTTLSDVSPVGTLVNIIAPNIHILNYTSLGFIIPLRFLLYLSVLYLILIITAVLTYEN